MTTTTEKVDAWMPLWIGSYLADTTDLDRHEHGGYLLLLFAYWRNKGPLLDDDKKLANTTKCKSRGEWRDLRATLAPLFDVGDGVWRHPRADEELMKAMLHKATATAKAKAGARARWEKSSDDAPSNAPSIAQALRGQCPTPSPIPSLLSGESGGDAPPAAAAPTPRPPKATKRKAKTPIPSEFEVSEGVKAWAVKKKFDRLDEHLEAFKLKVAANGYAYVDWDAAFQTAVRDDWAKLRTPQRGGSADPSATMPSNDYAKTKAAHAADDALIAAQDPDERVRLIAAAKAMRGKKTEGVTA